MAVGHREKNVTEGFAGEGPSPSRRDVEDRWLALLAGVVSRDEVHNWAEPWVMDEEERINDPMVRAAVQRLHGFDLVADPERPGVVRHGGGQKYGRWARSRMNSSPGAPTAPCTIRILRSTGG